MKNKEITHNNINPWLYISIATLLILSYLVGKAGGINQLFGSYKQERQILTSSTPTPTSVSNQQTTTNTQQYGIKREAFIYPQTGKSYSCDSNHISEIRNAGTAFNDIYTSLQKKIEDYGQTCGHDCADVSDNSQAVCTSLPYNKECFERVRTTLSNCIQSCKDIVHSDSENMKTRIAPFVQSLDALINKYCTE